ncbi:ABC transporter substrate-binding protein [Candidatus Weimeria sp. HCP3S3_B5]|uniref:ABC transporter substrate-binding protein n=1 Tax=Candidatus Weimeria sp. HCP3S3_B5 TaxID=3438871 RepID=UPI003F8A3DE1
MKRLITLILASAMILTATSCTNGGDGNNKNGKDRILRVDTAAEGANELSIAAWDENFNIPALRAAEKVYQKKAPGFRLKISKVAEDTDVEDAITLGGSNNDFSKLPDMVLFQDHSFNRFFNDYPNAWDKLSTAEINWRDFGQEKLSYSTENGIHYGIPLDNATAICAYRTDLLKQAGYTIDDLTGITWDRFDQIGKDVYEKTGKYLLSINADDNALPYMMLQAEGGSFFKDGKPYFVDNKLLIRVVNTIVKLARDNVLYLADNYSDYTDQTIKGDMVAGVMNGNWILPTIEQVQMNSGKWAITTLPTFSGEEGYAANGGSSIYITTACEKKELAEDFLSYTFGGGEGSKETYDQALIKGGLVTTCISAGNSDVYKEGVKYFNKQPIYQKVVDMSTHVKQVEQNDYHYTARQQLSFAIRNIIDGGDTVKAIKDAQDQVNFSMGLSD